MFACLEDLAIPIDLFSKIQVLIEFINFGLILK